MNGSAIKDNGVSNRSVTFNRTKRTRGLIASQSNDRLNFTRETDLRSAYPWHAFEKSPPPPTRVTFDVCIRRGKFCRGWQTCRMWAKSRGPRYVNVRYGAMHTDGVIKASGHGSTDTQLHPRAVNAQRWQYIVTRELNVAICSI